MRVSDEVDPLLHMTPEQRLEFEQWVSHLPGRVQEIARKYPPGRIYRLKSTGQNVYVKSYNRNQTVTVLIFVVDNPQDALMQRLQQNREVFGIPVDDLEAI